MVTKVHNLFEKVKLLFSHFAKGHHGLEALARTLLQGDKRQLACHPHVHHTTGEAHNVASCRLRRQIGVSLTDLGNCGRYRQPDRERVNPRCQHLLTLSQANSMLLVNIVDLGINLGSISNGGEFPAWGRCTR